MVTIGCTSNAMTFDRACETTTMVRLRRCCHPTILGPRKSRPLIYCPQKIKRMLRAIRQLTALLQAAALAARTTLRCPLRSYLSHLKVKEICCICLMKRVLGRTRKRIHNLWWGKWGVQTMIVPRSSRWNGRPKCCGLREFSLSMVLYTWYDADHALL